MKNKTLARRKAANKDNEWQVSLAKFIRSGKGSLWRWSAGKKVMATHFAQRNDNNSAYLTIGEDEYLAVLAPTGSDEPIVLTGAEGKAFREKHSL
jgi:hypothetical protein